MDLAGCNVWTGLSEWCIDYHCPHCLARALYPSHCEPVRLVLICAAASLDEAFCRGQGIPLDDYGKFVAAWEAAAAGAATLEGHCYDAGAAAGVGEVAQALVGRHGEGSVPAGESAAGVDGSSSEPQQPQQEWQQEQQQQ